MLLFLSISAVRHKSDGVVIIYFCAVKFKGDFKGPLAYHILCNQRVGSGGKSIHGYLDGELSRIESSTGIIVKICNNVIFIDHLSIRTSERSFKLWCVIQRFMILGRIHHRKFCDGVICDFDLLCFVHVN